MSALGHHLDDYLGLRRALGFKLVFPGKVLAQFVAHLDATGTSTISAHDAIAWAGLPKGVQPLHLAHRLGAIRGFARYLAAIDPATEILPTGIWPSANHRPTPYLWSESEIQALLDAARSMPSPLRAATHEALFGLLAASGMRVGEALRLERRDVDLAAGLITVHQAKGNRDRVVPLHQTTTTALAAYVAHRDRLCPAPRSTTFFVSSTGTALAYGGVHRVFIELTTAIGLRTPTVRPRMHDLRHSLAVRTLVEWHRSGVDVDRRMPVLSTYLGHVRPSGTYWYLSACPELMELVAARLDRRAVGRS